MHEFRCQFSEVRVEELYMSRGLLNFERLPTACLVLTSAILFFAFACGKSEPPKPRPPDVDVVQVEQKDVPIWKEWIEEHAAWAPTLVPLISAVVVVLVGRLMSPAESSVEGTVEEAVEAAALVGVQTVGQLLLARAPLIVAFIASAFGYSQGMPGEGDGAGMAASALDAVRPIFGAVIAIVIAELLAWLARRARGEAATS